MVAPRIDEVEEPANVRAAKVAAEIAARVAELEEIGAGRGAGVIHALAEIWRIDPAAFFFVAQAMTGDVEPTTASFAVLSERRDARPKQGLHYEWKQALRRMEAVFPGVSRALREIRASGIASGDPKKWTALTTSTEDSE